MALERRKKLLVKLNLKFMAEDRKKNCICSTYAIGKEIAKLANATVEQQKTMRKFNKADDKFYKADDKFNKADDRSTRLLLPKLSNQPRGWIQKQP